MMSRTHISIGVLAGIATLEKTPLLMASPSNWGLVLGGVVLGALLPDIDHPGSKISRYVPVIPSLFRWVKHRGLTHSLIGLFLVLNLATVLNMGAGLMGLDDKALGMGFMLGYVLHILADMLTPQGVKLFYPLNKTIGLPLITTGGNIELILRWICNGLIILGLILYFA